MYPELRRHRRLLKKLEPKHMSGDEPERDEKGIRVLPKVFRKIDAEWQSKELAAFFERLENQYRIDQADTPGNSFHTRLPSGGKSVDTIAPIGLPKNCYNPIWLAKKSKLKRAALNISGVVWDFSVPDNLGDNMEVDG